MTGIPASASVMDSITQTSSPATANAQIPTALGRSSIAPSGAQLADVPALPATPPRIHVPGRERLKVAPSPTKPSVGSRAKSGGPSGTTRSEGAVRESDVAEALERSLSAYGLLS